MRTDNYQANVNMPVDTNHATNDEHAVRAVISDMEAAWNRHDVRRFSELFAPNADFVTTVGSRFKGRAEIEQLHATLHASHYKDSHQTAGEVTVVFCGVTSQLHTCRHTRSSAKAKTRLIRSWLWC